MQAIVARYTRNSAEYSVVVTGHGKERKGTASDIVAARALTDTLVKEIVTEATDEPIVVHLLNDSAVEFTRSYLDATLFDHQPEHEADAPQADMEPPRRPGKSSKSRSKLTDRSRHAASSTDIAEGDSTGTAKDDAVKDDAVKDAGASS